MTPKWIQLCDKLISLTYDGKIDWTFSSSGDSILTTIGNQAIIIQRRASSFYIEILDDKAEAVDSFTDDDLISLGYNGYYGQFDEMFDMLRRRNSGADKVIDEILQELEKK